MKKMITTTLITTLIFLAGFPAHAEHHEGKKTMASKAYINSDAKAYAAMQALPADEPFDMLNMIRFRDTADYGDGSEFAEKGWTGAQAYAEYSRHSSPIATRVGGTVTYLGQSQLTMIGPEHEQWDAIFIISYPNLKSFLALVTDAEYIKHAFHRSAAVADSRLIRMAPSEELVKQKAAK